ncbi:hypothetical protein B0H10DRAFT_1811784, partial [Mycena sp. CBHHK59/15]
VCQLHSKGGGQHGTHQPITESTTITAISNLSVQVFEYHHATVFQGIPTTTSFLQTKQFAHIPSINFLCILSKTPKLTPTGLELFPEDAERFKKLQGGVGKFDEAMVLFRRCRKNVVAEAGEVTNCISIT